MHGGTDRHAGRIDQAAVDVIVDGVGGPLDTVEVAPAGRADGHVARAAAGVRTGVHRRGGADRAEHRPLLRRRVEELAEAGVLVGRRSKRSYELERATGAAGSERMGNRAINVEQTTAHRHGSAGPVAGCPAGRQARSRELLENRGLEGDFAAADTGNGSAGVRCPGPELARDDVVEEARRKRLDAERPGGRGSQVVSRKVGDGARDCCCVGGAGHELSGGMQGQSRALERHARSDVGGGAGLTQAQRSRIDARWIEGLAKGDGNVARRSDAGRARSRHAADDRGRRHVAVRSVREFDRVDDGANGAVRGRELGSILDVADRRAERRRRG